MGFNCNDFQVFFNFVGHFAFHFAEKIIFLGASTGFLKLKLKSPIEKMYFLLCIRIGRNWKFF
jgi:hypothetical protein